MKLARLLAVACGSAVALSAGCGGGGEGGGGGAQDPLAQGRASLSQLVSGQKATNPQTLQAALDLFNQAVQQSPNSPEANFGAAILLEGLVAQQVDGYSGDVATYAVGGGSGSAGSGVAQGGSSGGAGSGQVGIGDVPPVPPGQPVPQPLPPHHVLGLFWNLGAGLANPYALLDALAPVTDLRTGLIPFYGLPGDDATARLQMLANLDQVEQKLQQVEADPNFTLTITLPGPPSPPTAPGPGVTVPPSLPVQPVAAPNKAGATITAPNTPNTPTTPSTPTSITIGLPEVYLFDAYVNSLRAELALSLAYIRDPGANWQPPVPGVQVGLGTAVPASTGVPAINWTPASLDKDHDGELTPAEYLPPSPFLTLRDPKLMTAAQQDMLAIVDRAQKGIAGVFARSATDLTFLVPNTKDVHAQLAQIQSQTLPLIQQAATGPVTLTVPVWGPVEGGIQPLVTTAKAQASLTYGPAILTGGGSYQPAKVTVDLAAWFAKPPADLKVFAPTLVLNSQGWPDPSKTIYPDPTFGGLFPDGIKADLPY